MNKPLVISLGGSLINPGKIDPHYLKSFADIVTAAARSGKQLIIVCGGGNPARQYQDAFRKIGEPESQQLDWLGIAVTRLHAEFLRLLFGKLADKAVITDFGRRLPARKKILVAGGWKPGRSSDAAAVKLADLYGATEVINLSNIDYLFDKDPRRFSDAKKITRTDWSTFQGLVGKKWSPGANLPFDPTAAAMAKTKGFSLIIANGRNLKNFRRILSGKPDFLGTLVKD